MKRGKRERKPDGDAYENEMVNKREKGEREKNAHLHRRVNQPQLLAGTVSSTLYRPGGAVVALYVRVVQVASSNPALVIIFLLQQVMNLAKARSRCKENNARCNSWNKVQWQTSKECWNNEFCTAQAW